MFLLATSKISFSIAGFTTFGPLGPANNFAFIRNVPLGQVLKWASSVAIRIFMLDSRCSFGAGTLKVANCYTI